MPTARLRTVSFFVVSLAVTGSAFGCSASNDAAGGSDVCLRANAAASSCEGAGTDPIYPTDGTCSEDDACRASCIVASPCDWTTIGPCIHTRCDHLVEDSGRAYDSGSNGTNGGFADTGGGGSIDTGYGGFDGGGGGGGDTSSSTKPPRPECVSYAEKYAAASGRWRAPTACPRAPAGAKTRSTTVRASTRASSLRRRAARGAPTARDDWREIEVDWRVTQVRAWYRRDP